MTNPSRIVDPVNLQQNLRKLKIPRFIRDRIVVGLKRFRAPGAQSKRIASALNLPLPDCTDIAVMKAQGGCHIAAAQIPEALAAAQALDHYFEHMKEQGRVTLDGQHRKGYFLRPIARDDELLVLPEVRNFILCDEIVNLASHYLGEVPVLSGLLLQWSPPNGSCVESQMYHYDAEDTTQLKVLLLVKDVTADCGPFTYVKAPSSEKIIRTRRQSKRLDDETVEGVVGTEAICRVMGGQGSVAAVDTSRCLHYGSRGNRRERLMLFAQFTKFLAPKAHMPVLCAGNPPPVSARRSHVHRMILNLS